jgi:lysophospholipid acyltransferase (LPLAT)-like uncharacterized protein
MVPQGRPPRQPGGLLPLLPALFLWLLHRAWAASVHVRVINAQLLPARLPPAQNAIYVFWHAKLFMIPAYSQSSRMTALTLLDWKNRIFDRFCRLYRIRTVPVHSEAASTRALEELLEEGYHVALALDGPRGPAGVIQPGAIYLARKTGRPIICVNVRIERSIRLRRRWDRLEIPLPLNRVTGTLSDPIDATGLTAEEIRRKILEALPDL